MKNLFKNPSNAVSVKFIYLQEFESESGDEAEEVRAEALLNLWEAKQETDKWQDNFDLLSKHISQLPAELEEEGESVLRDSEINNAIVGLFVCYSKAVIFKALEMDAAHGHVVGSAVDRGEPFSFIKRFDMQVAGLARFGVLKGWEEELDRD